MPSPIPAIDPERLARVQTLQLQQLFMAEG